MPIRRLIVLLTFALSFAFAGTAHAFVYWADPHAGTIGRAGNDGSDPTDSFIVAAGEPTAVAVNAGHIYWANRSGHSIGRANIDGSEVESSFISGLGEPSGVAVTSTYIFWSDEKKEEIGRANLDGSSKQPNLILTESSPCGVAVDSGDVYWTNFDLAANHAYIGRATFSGGSVNDKFTNTEGAIVCGVAVNSANLFWADSGFADGTQIGRANASNGGAVNPSLIGDADGPCGVAAFGTQLFWANAGDGTIGRANTDGTAVDEEAIKTGGGEICGVAVDSLVAPPAPPAEPASPSSPSGPAPGGSAVPSSPAPSGPTVPAPSLRVVGDKLDKANGTAKVMVAVSGAGLVSLQGKGIVAAVKKARGAETVTLAVHAAKAKQATLHRVGRLEATLSITFAPSAGGGTPTASRSLTLVAKKKT